MYRIHWHITAYFCIFPDRSVIILLRVKSYTWIIDTRLSHSVCLDVSMILIILITCRRYTITCNFLCYNACKMHRIVFSSSVDPSSNTIKSALFILGVPFNPGDHSLILIIYQRMPRRCTQSTAYFMAISFVRDVINKSELFTNKWGTTKGFHA